MEDEDDRRSDDDTALDTLAALFDERVSDRSKYLLDRRYPVIVVVLALVALGGFYVGYTAHTTTETVADQRVTATWTTSSSFEHGAAVERDAVVFDEGVVLEDRTLYFTRVSPVLNGTYRLNHSGDAEPATARAEITVILRAADEVDDETVEYWRTVEGNESAEVDALPPDEPLTVDFSTNISRVLERIEEIEDDLEASPGQTEVVVLADAAIETEVDGEEFTDTRNDRLVIEPDVGTYTVRSEAEGDREQDATETVVTEIEPSFLEAYASVLAVLVAAFGAGATVWARRRGLFDLPSETVERIEFERARDEFDEWISRGSASTVYAEGEVRLDSLEDLVDVAIDSNRRVTELDDGSFVVYVDGVVYVYETDA